VARNIERELDYDHPQAVKQMANFELALVESLLSVPQFIGKLKEVILDILDGPDGDTGSQELTLEEITDKVKVKLQGGIDALIREIVDTMIADTVPQMINSRLQSYVDKKLIALESNIIAKIHEFLDGVVPPPPPAPKPIPKPETILIDIDSQEEDTKIVRVGRHSRRSNERR
jgi:hypothetical protein